MYRVQVDTSGEFTRMQRALMRACDEKQFRYAAAQAANDCTRAVSVAVNAAMPAVFDRPTAFTDRAAVAPRDLAATPDRLASIVTLRPIQAKYLLHEEIGGTRTPAENTRKASQALTLPGKGLGLDQFGNIPAGEVARFRRAAQANKRDRRKRAAVEAFKGQAAAAKVHVEDDETVVFLARDVAANKAGIGGYFRRLAGHKLTRLTVFEPATHYTPRLHYFRTFQATVANTWPKAMMSRLKAAIASAR